MKVRGGVDSMRDTEIKRRGTKSSQVSQLANELGVPQNLLVDAIKEVATQLYRHDPTFEEAVRSFAGRSTAWDVTLG